MGKVYILVRYSYCTCTIIAVYTSVALAHVELRKLGEYDHRLLEFPVNPS